MTCHARWRSCHARWRWFEQHGGWGEEGKSNAKNYSSSYSFGARQKLAITTFSDDCLQHRNSDVQCVNDEGAIGKSEFDFRPSPPAPRQPFFGSHNKSLAQVPHFYFYAKEPLQMMNCVPQVKHPSLLSEWGRACVRAAAAKPLRCKNSLFLLPEKRETLMESTKHIFRNEISTLLTTTCSISLSCLQRNSHPTTLNLQERGMLHKAC